MQFPTVSTKLVILLGNPLGHSISPAMHNCVFEKLGLDYCYMPVEVKKDDLQHVFNGLKRMNVGGFNVTIPHKVAIMEHLDNLSPIAKNIGAVNTICIENGFTTGHNTDGEGFTRSLEDTAEILTRQKTFFIIGCGGAARAIAMTLAFKGAKKIYLSNRTSEKATLLAAEINDKIGPCAEAVLHQDQQGPLLKSSDVIINCTSIGMHPNEQNTPLNTAHLRPGHIVADIVYNPQETRLLKDAKAAGCTVVPGLGMLIYQGAAAFKLWTDQEPLIPEMSTMAHQLMAA